MIKNQFLKKIEDEKIQLGEYIMVLDSITDEPLVIGCSLQDNVWKIYKTRERSGHYIIKEFQEEEAFDYFYD